MHRLLFSGEVYLVGRNVIIGQVNYADHHAAQHKDYEHFDQRERIYSTAYQGHRPGVFFPQSFCHQALAPPM